jgi:hypothetical protein
VLWCSALRAHWAFVVHVCGEGCRCTLVLALVCKFAASIAGFYVLARAPPLLSLAGRWMWIGDGAVTLACDPVQLGLLLWTCHKFNEPVMQLAVRASARLCFCCTDLCVLPPSLPLCVHACVYACVRGGVGGTADACVQPLAHAASNRVSARVGAH